MEEVAIATFRDEILLVIAFKATTAVIKMVTDERDGAKIDQALLRRVCDIYVHSGLETEEVYEMNFERSFLYDTKSYYSGRTSKWIVDDSFPDYMLKLEESLKHRT